MNTKDLEYITVVAEEGNITKAAQRLFIAQPSLSQCIHKIEEQLGTQLFVRTNSGITLTYAGEIFLDASNKISKTYRDMENAISDMNNMKRGRLVVGVPTLLACQIMPRIYSNYVQKYPGIDVILYEQESKTLESSLIKGKTDLAIMALPLGMDLNYETIFTCEMVLCAPPNHPLLKFVDPETNIFDITQLNNQPFILARPHQKTRFVVDSILKKAGITVQTALMTSSSETAMFLSAHGLGFAILPEFAIRYYQPLLPITYYRIDPKFASNWTVVVAHTRNDYLSTAAQLFIEEIHALYTGGNTPLR